MSNKQKDGWSFANHSVHSRQNNVKSRPGNKSWPACQSAVGLTCRANARFWNILKVFDTNLDDI